MFVLVSTAFTIATHFSLRILYGFILISTLQILPFNILVCPEVIPVSVSANAFSVMFVCLFVLLYLRSSGLIDPLIFIKIKIFFVVLFKILRNLVDMLRYLPVGYFFPSLPALLCSSTEL